MILSVSRRTDIPAFYSDWFYQRVKEGFAYVRNPMNIHQISKVAINTDVVDCIVFWTKNPKPMLSRLDELKQFNYYFQFSINPYSQSLEQKVPKKEMLINTFKQLSEKIGEKKMIWRYDPILYTEEIDLNYHVKYFEELTRRLSPYTKRCVISFIDNYKKTERNLKGTTARELTDSEIFNTAKRLVEIANHYNIEIQSCSEKIELAEYGIEHGRCIDHRIVEELIGFKLNIQKDKNQRKECGCVESIDIGEYNTCGHSCLYCYANFNKTTVEKKRGIHDPFSPLLIGKVEPEDKVVERRVCPLKRMNSLF